MLFPEYIDHLPDRVVELYADLEIRILEDMARRISKTGALTETAQWQMWRLEQIGAEREFIRYHIQRFFSGFYKQFVNLPLGFPGKAL